MAEGDTDFKLHRVRAPLERSKESDRERGEEDLCLALGYWRFVLSVPSLNPQPPIYGNWNAR